MRQSCFKQLAFFRGPCLPLDQLRSGPNLIQRLEAAEVVGDGAAELAAFETGAAVVDSVGDVFQLGVRGNVCSPGQSCEPGKRISYVSNNLEVGKGLAWS